MAEPIESEAQRVYLGLRQAFDAAGEVSPGVLVESWFLFAGRPGRLRVMGRRLSEVIARPFAHLRIPPAPGVAPALRVDLWDETETGVRWVGGDPESDPTLPGQVTSSGDGRFVVSSRARACTAFDRQAAEIVGWVSGVESLTLYELGRPLHAQLLLWHCDRRVQAVHAGLVASGGAGILFGGPGGAGKTTVALTCLSAGFDYLADDYVGLEPTDADGFSGYSLYASTHVDPNHLRRFPALLPYAISGQLPGEDKSLILLPPVFPGRCARHTEIRAVALPLVTGGPRTSWRPASPVEALLRLAPTSLFMLPHVGTGIGFQVLARLVEKVPTFWLELGTDLDEIPVRVAELLKQAASGNPGRDRQHP